MTEMDFPSLFISADSSSIKAQKKFFIALKIYLFLLVVAALSSFLFPSSTYAAIFSAFIFISSLAILSWINLAKPQAEWFSSRAIAESVKTMTWRWVTCAEPYNRSSSIREVKSKFLNDLALLLDKDQIISKALAASPNEGEMITARMIDIRNSNWQSRLSTYLTHRIDEQSSWYLAKSKENKRLSKHWFTASIVLHLVAIVLLLFKIGKPELLTPIGLISTAASASLSWIQARRYDELNISYSIAVHEIAMIREEASSLVKESDFANFVINSEAAFSREHTKWVARRIC